MKKLFKVISYFYRKFFPKRQRILIKNFLNFFTINLDF